MNSRIPTNAHACLNRVVAIGIGHRVADGHIYSIFEVL